ncbi:MAG: Hpt domain-containing protein [Thermodesulfobacteriota bacterium]|nr:Hpt domain-containing protein [Thermodesulfobacteriota bacterium]
MNNLTEPIDMAEVMGILDGDKELLIECFDELLNSMPQTLAEIQSAIEQGNALSLDEAAHKLKGSLIYMAAAHAADVAYQLETMGKEQNLGSADDTFKTLSYECEKVKEFMKQYKEGT